MVLKTIKIAWIRGESAKNTPKTPQKQEKSHFSEKKHLKSLQVPKKAVPLQPQYERCSSDKEEICGNSSVGRAQPCQGWGRGSESRFPL